MRASCNARSNLFLILFSLVAAVTLLGSSLGLLPLDATGAATTKWRSESKVNVLLGVETDDERWHVDYLLADAAES